MFYRVHISSTAERNQGPAPKRQTLRRSDKPGAEVTNPAPKQQTRRRSDRPGAEVTKATDMAP